MDGWIDRQTENHDYVKKIHMCGFQCGPVCLLLFFTLTPLPPGGAPSILTEVLRDTSHSLQSNTGVVH